MAQNFESDFELYRYTTLLGPATWPQSCETSVHDLFDDNTHQATVEYIRKKVATGALQTCKIKWIKSINSNEWIVIIDPGDGYTMAVKKKSSKNKIGDQVCNDEGDQTLCCKVCFVNKVTHCFDCGHIVCCHSCTCAIRLNNDPRCPICRVHVKNPIRVYFT